jgi:UDP:flavonoid glycosyltransferase YjiC (YdhE family)
MQAALSRAICGFRLHDGMKRAFLAWEIGGGRGHVVHLAAVAASLKRRGYCNVASLAHLDHADELASYCEQVEQAPQLPYRAPTDDDLPSSHYGDWLGLHHFDDSAVIRHAIERWRSQLIAARPDIVIAEQTPCGILAARSLSLPVVQIGVPTTAPPAEMSAFPPYLSDRAAAMYDEAVLCAAVNDAVASFGLPALPALPGIYTCDDQIIASIKLFDRYAEWRRQPRVPPVVGGWREPGERRREEVFVYLSTLDRLNPVILTAIGSLRIPTRVFVADNLAMAVAVIGRGGAVVEDRPRPPSEIARASRVLVHAGNHGMCCLGIRAGLPQVTIAGQMEHRFDGRVLAQSGSGINVESPQWTVPNIQAAIERAWDDAGLAERARALAEQYAAEFTGDPGEMTVDRIEAVLR